MPNAAEVHVKGLREMQRAFARADKDLAKELRSTLKDVAEPVRADAAVRALQGIRNIGKDWSRMRTGVTSRLVYVAPARRGRQSSLRRPNLAALLMDRAMQPALDAHSGEIENELGRMIDHIADDWGRGG